MAKTIKQLPKESRETQTPGGQPDVLDIIQGNVLEFATTMSMMNASYYTGKATDGKDLKQAQSKVQANKKSILGDKDSIFQLLDEIKKTITSKENEVLFTAIKHLANNSLAIKNALYINEQPLSDIIDKLVSSNTENIFKFDEAQFGTLKDIIEDKNLDNIMGKVVNAETRADKALEMANNYYESFKDTALKNETNIQKIIDAFKEQSNSNQEELQNLIVAFTNSNQNLFNINEEIRKDNENKIVEAKLKLMLEGIDPSTIDSLIKFSNLNLDKLGQNTQSLITFFKSLKVLEKMKLKEINDSLNNMSIIIDTINKMKGLDGKARQKIATIAGFFGESKGKGGKKINESLLHIFRSIDRMVIPNTKTLNGIANSVNDIKNIIESLNSINDISKKPDKILENLEKYLKVLEESYKNIQEKFDQIIATGKKAEKIKLANEKIAGAMESTNETIVKTSSNEKDIKKSVIAIEGMTEFMVGAAIVMSIGALIMMMGGGKFVKAALQFGITLAIFEGLVLMPALIFNSHKENALKGIEGFNSFIITCAITMTLGALVMMLGGGKLVKNALQFGITLGLFELIVLAPMLAFAKVKNNVFESLKEFNSFIVTCTIVMLVGALAVQLGGGKMIKNALKFGIALMQFEAIVIAPFLLFGLIKNQVFENAKGFTSLLITTTIVFLIGAAIMALSGGKMVKYAMEFALTLMKFEAMIIAPFLLFNLLRKSVFDGIKSFSTVVMVCTITLLVGAFFMKKPEWVKAAMEFAWTLMKFEALVIAPFLLFKLIGHQVMGGLKDFAIVVLVTTTVLLVGALFMTMGGGKYPWAALEFAGLLAIFEIAVIAPILAFKLTSNEALSGAKDFGIFVALCSFSLIIGAFFIANYGSKPVVEFGIVLGGFVFATTIAMTIFSAKGKTLVSDAEQFGVFVLLSSAALLIGALFIAKYGMGSALAYAVLLGLFIAGISAVMIAVDIAFTVAGGESKVMLQMMAVGGFILLTSASLALGSYIIDKYGWKPLLYTLLLGGFIVAIAAIFAIIGLPPVCVLIGLGAAAGLLLGLSLTILTSSLMIINLMFELDPGGKNLSKNIMTLAGVISLMSIPYTLLGILSLLIIPGSIAATAMGASMLILGGAFAIINMMIGKHGGELANNIMILNELLGWDFLGKTYTILGLLSIPIMYGSLAAIAMGASLTLLCASISLIPKFIAKIKDTIFEDLNTLDQIIESIGNIGITLAKATIPLTLGLAGLGLVNIFCFGLWTSTAMISKAVKNMNEVGDLSKNIDQIIKNIQLFLDIPDKIDFGGIGGIFSKMATIGIVEKLAMPLGKTMKTIAVAVGDIASLKVATKWDNEGNPINYRNLSDKDFELAYKNISTLLIVMADAFHTTWFGTGKIEIGGRQVEFKGLQEIANDPNGGLWKTLFFGRQIGEVIKGVSEGVGAMAKMQIPIAWDEKGNPIGYRQLKEKDFELASIGVSTILTAMTQAIMEVYKLGYGDFGQTSGKNIFDMVGGGLFGGDEQCPFINTLEASLKIGELIGNIGTAVGNIAKMQIPIEWDEKGKVINYRTLNKSDFTNMGKGVSFILTEIIRCLGGLYSEGKKFDPEGKVNIFDAVSGGFLGGDDKPSPIMRVIEASLKISELIANLGEGIQNIATLQIPDDWDEKGKVIHYRKLNNQDFTAAATAVGTIVTSLANALTENKTLLEESDTVGEVLQAILPMSELVSGMSEGIVNLASGLVADQWDPKTGKPIHYMRLTPADYILAGVSIAAIISCMATSIINAATQQGADGQKPLLEIFEGDTFKGIIEAISGLGDLVSNIADSVIKIGQAQIPIDWDKNGKAIRYDKIDIPKAEKNLETTISRILMATIRSIINVYNGTGHGMQGKGLKDLLNGSEDSPFLLAVQGIGEVSKTVSNLVDSVVKIGSALIPDRWDKDGKPTHYHPIDVNSAIQNIKTMFEGTGVGDGLLTVLCNIVNGIAIDYFKGENNISEDINLVANGMNTIIGIISKSAKLVVDISSLKIPTGYDKEGKATGYHIMNLGDILNAQMNSSLIITSLLSIFNTKADQQGNKTGGLSEYINNMTTIKANALIINEGLTTVGTTLKTAMNQIKNILKYDEDIAKLYSIQSHSKENTSSIPIGILRDIYHIINAFSLMNTAVQKISFNNVKILDDMSDQISTITSFTSTSILFMNGLIHDILRLDINEIVKCIYDPNANEYIPKLIENMVKTYDLVFHHLAFNPLTGLPNEIIQKLFKNLHSNIQQVHKILAYMFVNYDYLSTKITKAKNNTIDIVDIYNIVEFYKKSIVAISNLYDSFFNNDIINENLNLALLNYNLGQVADILGSMFGGISDTYETYYNNIQAFKNNINDIIGQLQVSDNGLAISMQNLKTNLDYLEMIYTTSFKNIDFTKNTILDDISNDISYFISTAIDPFGPVTLSKATSLNTSIDNIYQSLSKQKDQSKAFKSNTNALQTYIKAINSVDIKKVSALSSLVNGLNKLAGQLGNLDRLTEAISNDLAEVLKDLVDSLIEAKETINDAHELQAERAKQIEQSISKVRNIMNSPLNVTIQSATSDTSNLTPGDPENPDSKSPQITTKKGNEDQSKVKDGKKEGNKTKDSRAKAGEGTTNKKS